MFRCSYKDKRRFPNCRQEWGTFVQFSDASGVAAWCLGRTLSEIKIEKLTEVHLPDGMYDCNEIERYLNEHHTNGCVA